jgi:hypothetical protein
MKLSVKSDENAAFLLDIYDNISTKDTLLDEHFITKPTEVEMEGGTSSYCLAMMRECKDALNVINMHGNKCSIILPVLTLTLFFW